MSKEMEIRFKLDDYFQKIFFDWLNKNADFKGVVDQHDFCLYKSGEIEYYSQLDGFHKLLKYLRVRLTNKGDFVCFKEFQTDEQGKKTYFCDEFETSVANGKTMIHIFEKLGFLEKVELQKTRTTYKYKDFEIAIDDVLNYGICFEIELQKTGMNADKALHEIYNLLRSMGIKKITRMHRGYIKKYTHDPEEEIVL
ncbi:MAG: Adenylyl cyclase CyaB [candidate division TM6 bacterium GW2011_GWF2_32_72]|nr:MAG: Adenylyl cyclase CyaB [candidate division TM6 bacterium GW2011_GWF2_32_72]